MRKTSQDTGDCTSITSGLDNDIKKPGAGILKTKKSSLKRKVQTFSLESDDGVAEPLLRKDQDKAENINQSAKFLTSKSKTDSTSDKGDEKDKLLADNKTSVASMTNVPGITDNQVLINGVKESTISSAAPIHKHMNTSAFGNLDGVKNVVTPKSTILVKIDPNKQKVLSPSPLIFTTAKIHTDGKTKALEPVQVTPVPIWSTVEGNVVKAGTTTENLRDNKSNTTMKSDLVSNNVSPCVSTVSVTFYSEILSKGPPKASDCNSVSPFVVTELKTFKMTCDEDTTKATKDNNTQVKDKVLTGASSSNESEKTNKSAIGSHSANISYTISSSSQHTNARGNNQSRTSNVSEEAVMDIIKNVQPVSVASAQDSIISMCSNIRDVTIADKAAIQPCSLSNKNLRRQKNSIKEATGEKGKVASSVDEESKNSDKKLDNVNSSKKIDSSTLSKELIYSTKSSVKSVAPVFSTTIATFLGTTTPLTSELKNSTTLPISINESMCTTSTSSAPYILSSVMTIKTQLPVSNTNSTTFEPLTTGKSNKVNSTTSVLLNKTIESPALSQALSNIVSSGSYLPVAKIVATSAVESPLKPITSQSGSNIPKPIRDSSITSKDSATQLIMARKSSSATSNILETIINTTTPSETSISDVKCSATLGSSPVTNSNAPVLSQKQNKTGTSLAGSNPSTVSPKSPTVIVSSQTVSNIPLATSSVLKSSNEETTELLESSQTTTIKPSASTSLQTLSGTSGKKSSISSAGSIPTKTPTVITMKSSTEKTPATTNTVITKSTINNKGDQISDTSKQDKSKV